MDRLCLYCAERFHVENQRRIFCSDKCKTRHNRETNLTCFYCGELADTKDHITPHSTENPGLVKWLGRDTVNCCRECNNILGTNYPYNLFQRANFLKDKLIKKYNLDKGAPEWDDDEVRELGRSLRERVNGKIRTRQRAQNRVLYLKAVILEIARNTAIE
jgi:hypothetical protein